MKLKLISMLAGAVVFAVPLTSVVAHAQSSSPIQTAPGMSGVELTPQQKNKLAQIRQTMQSEIENILTADQRNRYKAAMQSGQSMQQAVAAMKITPEQQTKLRRVVQSYRSQIETTLTPEQRRQIQENMMRRRGAQ